MTRMIIAKTLAGIVGLIGLVEIVMGLHMTSEAISDPDSAATWMIPMFLIPGVCQVAAGAGVLWEYGSWSVRSLSFVLGIWVWFLAGLAIEQTGVWATRPPDVTWHNVAVFAPIIAGVLVYQVSSRVLAPEEPIRMSERAI